LIIATVKVVDQFEKTEGSIAHFAFALTGYVPLKDQLFKTLVVPTGNQPESVSSPQSKKYCTGWCMFDEEPSAE
jgi:hypothetical protein